ncbi:two component transcriptional regulator, LytTR family [Sinomicrobium oceani]|uniref:Two component transcriptional regulator, LytTR family n=1 Tax=Sinomicrobium oceani TaxID=1150368 RepID=A0A1K1QT38_9FLAO|nr:LytTR family DNA-binding domain-containing protein [Sinomicrobium oceani]SFW62852.1 two component transcriptional regulator, LytTR family [Sinomicrobium oceani]
MRILIIEDEHHTANRLRELLSSYHHPVHIAGMTGSIRDTLKWYAQNPMPDLVFQDVELSDGNCFAIFEAIEISAPIVFTTAYSEYALRSFEVNNLDYIVKPYEKKDVFRALDKLKKVKDSLRNPGNEILREVLKPEYKGRLLVKLGDFYQSISITSIACFQSEDGLTIARTFSGDKHFVELSVNSLSQELDPRDFFQINRKFIISISAISSIRQWFGNRLKVTLKTPVEEDIIVSRERVRHFKAWLNH